MPPTPKPDAQRRRRNKSSKSDHLDPEPREVSSIPALPKLAKGRKFSPVVIEWWADVHSSPMSVRYQPADLDALRRLARLKQDEQDSESGEIWRTIAATVVEPGVVEIRVSFTPNTALLKAILDLEDRFLLSPKSRQVARVEIDTKPKAKPLEVVATGTDGTPVAGSGVRRLRAVDDALARS